MTAYFGHSAAAPCSKEPHPPNQIPSRSHGPFGEPFPRLQARPELLHRPVVGEAGIARRAAETGIPTLAWTSAPPGGTSSRARPPWNRASHRLRHGRQQFPVLPAATPIQAGRDVRDYFQHVLSQLLFKTALLPLVDDHHFHPLEFAQSEHQLRVEAQ